MQPSAGVLSNPCPPQGVPACPPQRYGARGALVHTRWCRRERAVAVASLHPQLRQLPTKKWCLVPGPILWPPMCARTLWSALSSRVVVVVVVVGCPGGSRDRWTALPTLSGDFTLRLIAPLLAGWGMHVPDISSLGSCASSSGRQ
eukprot:scaffold7258_cov122-Isochrysis_galbana.AAC.5